MQSVKYTVVLLVLLTAFVSGCKDERIPATAPEESVNSEPEVPEVQIPVRPEHEPEAMPPVVAPATPDPFLNAPVPEAQAPARIEAHIDEPPAYVVVVEEPQPAPILEPAPEPIVEPEPIPEPVIEPPPAAPSASVFVAPLQAESQIPARVEDENEPVVVPPAAAPVHTPLDQLFVDWQKPKLLLVFTGFLDGYIEPCGCAGLDQMKGGLSRRHTFFKELEKKGWDVLPIDAGNLNKGFSRQEEMKFNFVIDEALRVMKYEAAGIGSRELLLPTDTLILYTVDTPGTPKRYTSANVALIEFSPDFVVPYRIFEKNGMKIGVTSVIGNTLLKEVNNEDIKYADAAAKLQEVLPKLDEAQCDKRVLIVHGTTEEINAILKTVPDKFDFVIPSDTPAEPPLKPSKIGNSMLIEVGEKGRYAVAVGLYEGVRSQEAGSSGRDTNSSNSSLRYERIPFDSRFESSKTVVGMMQLYQEQLEKTGLKALGIQTIPDERSAEHGKFIGTKSCMDCHEASYKIWQKSGHAKAWESLARTAKPARTFDPECIACHVVGWNPAQCLPYSGGFSNEKETPHLVAVGCESCHGPGELHSKAEQGSDEAAKEKLRLVVRLPLGDDAAKKHCITCHDGDNSPHFDFNTYWQKIVHKENE
jgi:hypothetical protein